MAGDFKGRRFDAGLFASAFLDPLHLIAVGLAPAHIHAAHHLGPILGLGTAGAGMDFQEAVIAVGFPRQQAFDLLFLANLGQRGDVRLGLADDVAVIFHFAEFDQLQTIRQLAFQIVDFGDAFFDLGALSQQGLRFIRVVPEVLVIDQGGQFGKADFGLIVVKDASLAVRSTA